MHILGWQNHSDIQSKTRCNFTITTPQIITSNKTPSLNIMLIIQILIWTPIHVIFLINTNKIQSQHPPLINKTNPTVMLIQNWTLQTKTTRDPPTTKKEKPIFTCGYPMNGRKTGHLCGPHNKISNTLLQTRLFNI